MSFPQSHNIGGYIAAGHGSDNVAVTAAGAGDNTLVTGTILDRNANAGALSAAVLIFWKAVLAAAETLTIKSVTVEHGNDAGLSDAAVLATLEDATGTVVATGPGGGGTLRGVRKYNVDLAGAKRYIRVKFTPDLSASATDTAGLAAGVVFGGLETL